MTNEQRTVLDLAEAWFEAQEDGLPHESWTEEHALYRAIAGMRETCIRHAPSTPVVTEALEQAATEFDRQRCDGWHLIDVEEKVGEDEFGKPIMRPLCYLETDCV